MKRHHFGSRTTTGLFRPIKSTMAFSLTLSFILLAPGGPAMAQCLGTNTLVNCVGAVNNSAIIGPGNTTAGDGWTINVGTTTDPAMVTNNGNTVFSVHDKSTITINNNSIVQGNTATGSGLYGTGPNVIEFNSGNNVYIGAGAVVQQLGNTTNGEALNAHGNANTITNYGTIHSHNGAALWFQDTNDDGTGTRNTVVNHGTISTDKGAGYNVFGSSSGVNAPGLVFENYGTVQGSLRFGNGNDSLLFGTGSYISGNVDGGGGTNDLTLDATTVNDSAPWPARSPILRP